MKFEWQIYLVQCNDIMNKNLYLYRVSL